MAPGSARLKCEGWKEIAQYFGRTERNVQELAKTRDLPVHRLGGRVYAYVDELEIWRLAQATPSPVAPVEPANELTALAGAPPSLLPRRLLFAGALVVVAGAVLALGFGRKPRQPARFSVDGYRLAVRDSDNELLWTVTLPHRVRRPQDDSYESPTPFKFVDLDGDKLNEFLLVYHDYEGDEVEGTFLYCFGANGRFRWRHKLGREVRKENDGSARPPDYNYLFVEVLRTSRRDGGRIVAGGHRGGSALFVVEVLDPRNGRAVADYFHPGWLFAVACADLDKDGRDEILLGGVNNSFSDRRRGATLVILDSERVEGQGPLPAEGSAPWRLAELPLGREKAVLLFPDLVQDDYVHNYWKVRRIKARVDLGFLEVVTDNARSVQAIYQFDRHARFQRVQPDMITQSILFRDHPGRSPEQKEHLATKMLSDIIYLKNDLDPDSVTSLR